jgi:arylsulfatase A-like enzyme
MGRNSHWPRDAYCARRLALEKPGEFASLRRAGLERVDRAVARIFEETRDLEDVVYLVYSNHGEMFDHFRHNLQFSSSTIDGLRMVEGTSHGNYPYEVLYANMQMWLIPGYSPRVMSGIGRSVDITPTILDLAGITPAPMDGESMLGYFSGGREFPDRDRYAETPISGGCLSMVRADGFKLISVVTNNEKEDARYALRGFGDHSIAVFDLNSDPYEYVNLIDTAQGRDVAQWAVNRQRELKVKWAE